MSARDTLQARFGGSWDGPDERLNGLVSVPDGELKIDVVARGDEYLCSVFSSGTCLASARAATAVDAVSDALAAVSSREHPDS